MSQTNNNPRQGGRKPSSMDVPFQLREENHPLHRHATALVEDLFDAGLAGGNRSHKGQYIRWMLGKVRGDREGNSNPGEGAYDSPYAKDTHRDPVYAGWSPNDWKGRHKPFNPSMISEANRSTFIKAMIKPTKPKTTKKAKAPASAPKDVSVSDYIRKTYNEQVALYNSLEERRKAKKIGDQIPVNPSRPPYSLAEQKKSLEKLNDFLRKWGLRLQRFLDRDDLKHVRQMIHQIAKYEVEKELAFNYGVDLPDYDYSNMSLSPASKKKFENELNAYITEHHDKIETEALNTIMYQPELSFGRGHQE